MKRWERLLAALPALALCAGCTAPAEDGDSSMHASHGGHAAHGAMSGEPVHHSTMTVANREEGAGRSGLYCRECGDAGRKPGTDPNCRTCRVNALCRQRGYEPPAPVNPD